MLSAAEKIKPGEVMTDDQVSEVDAAIRRSGFSSRKGWVDEADDLSPNVFKQIMAQNCAAHRKYAESMNELVEEQLIVRYQRSTDT